MGASAIIFPGVIIGSGVIIGAWSIVTEDIPSGVVAVENSARVVLTLAEFLERRTAEMHSSPSFGEEYTLRGAVTEQRKAEMNARLTNRFGYID